MTGQISLQDGLRQTIDWYKEFLNKEGV